MTDLLQAAVDGRRAAHKGRYRLASIQTDLCMAEDVIICSLLLASRMQRETVIGSVRRGEAC
jgi:hypothetical protein